MSFTLVIPLPPLAAVVVEYSLCNTWAAVKVKSTGTCNDTACAPINIPLSSLVFWICITAVSIEASDNAASLYVLVCTPADIVGWDALKNGWPSPIASAAAVLKLLLNILCID